MATLNLSTNGPSISKSYQTVVDAALAGSSPTYGQWVVYSVSAPLTSAFQQDSSKESVLKVQSTGDGELADLVEDFSDGRVQFAFVKVKDPNTSLPKCVLIAWCGAGVPERTKGYFGSHLTTVAKLLHGYHVQVTARSEHDLSPDAIIQKVADASGSKYAGDAPVPKSGGPPPPVASKPVFTPTAIGGTAGGFNPLRSRAAQPEPNVDADGWGADAPPVTRTELEKVQPAYQPTKVDMASLTLQKPASSSAYSASREEQGSSQPDVVKGAYQPVGKVDIAAIRRQAQGTGKPQDDRPTVVKGAYEPVGTVDIAAIRARAQPPGPTSPPQPTQPEPEQKRPQSLTERSAAFQDTGRITALPKPKVANRFGSQTSGFAGTKAPMPGGFEAKPVTGAAAVGTASRTFADEGGKTPAQVWAEKKARERGLSGAGDAVSPVTSPTQPIQSQGSGEAGWKSGYTGKTWAPVEIVRPGVQKAQITGEEAAREEQPASPQGGVSALRDRFTGAPPMVGGTAVQVEQEDAPPPLPLASRPGGAVAIPGMSEREEAEAHVNLPPPPAQPPRSATPPTPAGLREGSPIRIAQPVAREADVEIEAPAERLSPPVMPARTMARNVPQEPELEEEEPVAAHDPARSAGQAAAAASFGAAAAAAAPAQAGGQRAIAQYDYEKAEDNELELRDGEYIVNIDMVDEDWWMGENSRGETGLFPANYVELVDDNGGAPAAPAAAAAPVAAPAAAPAAKAGNTATAQYEYEAAEDNELSFPDGAKITNIEFLDEAWWLGHYNGQTGLFPANYVELDR